MLLLFFVGPAIGAVAFHPRHVLGVLAVLTVGSLVVLLLDKSFDRRSLWNWAAARREMPGVFLRFGVLVTGVIILLLIFAPELWLSFPRRAPVAWLLVMCFYPVFSVYPQEVVWRTFFHHRYRVLFKGRWRMIAASAAAFGWMHIVFQNWLAVVMTIAGGLLFAYTYERSRSTAAVWVEHALWGCAVFTIGLGAYFFGGAVR